MTSNIVRVAIVVLLSALAGCGGNMDSSSGAGTNTNGGSPVRGTLLQSQFASTLSASDLSLQLSAAANQLLLGVSGTPVCDVQVYHVEYDTVGGAGEATTASAALMVPSGTDSRCQGARSIVLYAHGTNVEKTFNIANLGDSQNAEGLLLAAIFVTQGYIVVAPNYAGYDTSTLSYHPFLLAAQQSKDMIDALTAARAALPVAQAPATSDGGKLFITGYSEGGYVAMATHAAMQAAGMPVTASAPMSGPYAVAAFVDAIFEGDVNNDATVTGALLLTGYQHSYGNIYSTDAQVFTPTYASGIDALLPTTLARSQLYSAGKLPQYALFDSTPPDPSYAGMTPATSASFLTDPTSLAAVFAQGFGSDYLLLNSYRQSYLQDAQANPDEGWPTTTSTALPASSPALPFRQALKRNDLRSWSPAAPTLLCGGDEDPTVFWLNTVLMNDYWMAAAPTSPYALLDVDAAYSGSGADPYASERAGFASAKQALAVSAVLQGASDGGQGAVQQAYHSTLVAPFCVAAVRTFFNAH